MINLSIAANNHHDLHEQLKGILHGLAQAPAGVLVNGAAQQGAPSILDAGKNLPKMTKKQEAALKAAAEQAAVTGSATLLTTVEDGEVVVTQVETEAQVETPSIDDLRAALMSLSKAEGHGSEAVFKLLETFSAKNASTVREDQRALVIAAVKQKLEG